MQTVIRLRHASKVAFVHFGVSLLLAMIVATLVFRIWYPDGLHLLTGGGALFLILMAVDVVCGPVLTLVLYNPAKSKIKWRIDMGLIALTQVAALAYGLVQVADARPVFLAFEGDRFRVVQAFDVDATRVREAPDALQVLPWNGPKLLGTRLADPSDPDFLASVQMSLEGLHPAFRPTRWRPYNEQVSQVLERLKPINDLRLKNADRISELDAAVRKFGQPQERMGYLPLVRDDVTDWVIVIHRPTGMPLGYLPLDGW